MWAKIKGWLLAFAGLLLTVLGFLAGRGIKHHDPADDMAGDTAIGGKPVGESDPLGDLVSGARDETSSGIEAGKSVAGDARAEAGRLLRLLDQAEKGK